MAACEDCGMSPCCCAEWEEELRRFEGAEAERAAAEAETNLPELWEPGPDGLLRRRKVVG